MESHFILLSFFPLIFFNSAHSVCVPRNHTAPAPVSSSPKPQPTTPPPATSKPTPPESSPPATQHSPGPSIFRRPNKGNPGLSKICASTDYPDVCQATLAPLVKGASDVHSVLNFAIKAGSEVTKTAQTVAKRLATMPGTPPDMASMYKDCEDSYDDALYNFQNAMDALPGSDVGTMNTMLSAVITDIGDCEDTFQGLNCPLATYSEKVTKMASNCLAIVSLLHN